MSWIIPAAAGALGAAATVKGAKADIGALSTSAGVANAQANADEEAQRRLGRQVMGSQAAAMAEAGGGGDAGVARQSAIAAELDALNIRYGGRAKAYSLLAQAKNVARMTPLLAGAQLIGGGSNAYAQYKGL